MMRIIGLLLALLATPALAQNQPLFATGALTPGHALVLQQTGTPGSAVTRDGGPALAGNFTELGITNDGLPLCVRDKAGQHLLCMGANALGGGLISYNPIGGGAPFGFNLNINGTTYPFPGAGNGNVSGPTSPSPTANDVVVWNGGTTVADSKIMAINSNTTGGGQNGNATILATPPLGLVGPNDHTIGINVVPTFVSANATSDFMGGIEVNLGAIGAPIPAGTKGMPVGIVANVTTNQALADQQAQNNGTAFAATVTVSNGAWFDGLDMDLELSGPNARNIGIGMNINNNQTGGGTAPVQGISLLAQGTRNADTGIHIFGGVNVGGSGAWTVGVQTDAPVQIGTDETVRPCWLCVVEPNFDTRRTAMFYQAVGAPVSGQDVVLITAFSAAQVPDFNLLRVEDNNGQNPGSGVLEFAVAAGGAITTHLPTSAGSGGLSVCVDSAGLLYKKATCP